MLRLIVALLLLFGSAASAPAARIFIERPPNSAPWLVVEGDLVAGDEKVFNNLAISVDQAIVILNSSGGLAYVGMAIGRTIAIKGFATVVLPNSICASSCGIAWLAGRPRSLFPTSKIGFHAVFRTDGGSNEVSSEGNALVGSYLRELGLTDRAIIYITMAQPASMKWLSQADAAAIGLEVMMLNEGQTQDHTDKDSVPVPSAADRSNIEESDTEGANAAKAMPPERWTTLDNTDLMGFDLSEKPIQVQNSSDCMSLCDKTNRCSAYTFNQRYKACFLKWGASQALQFSGALSGYKGSNIVQRIGRQYGNEIQFRTSIGTEIIAMPYSTYMNKTLAWCQDDCVDDFQCKGFSYYRNGICVKFRDRKPVQVNKEVFSGVKLN